MENIAEQFEHNGFTVKLIQDEDATSPREWDNLGVMCHWHRRYELGDREATETEMDALRRGGFRLLERYLRMTEGALCVLPLGLLDHSGLHMWVGGGSHWSDSAGWDSGTVGFIYITKKRMEELCGAADYKPADFEGTVEEWVKKQAENEVATYDQFLTGDVWGYVIEDQDGEHIDSCWGFYGFDYAKQQAIEAADYRQRWEIEQQDKLQQCLAL